MCGLTILANWLFLSIADITVWLVLLLGGEDVVGVCESVGTGSDHGRGLVWIANVVVTITNLSSLETLAHTWTLLLITLDVWLLILIDICCSCFLICILRRPDILLFILLLYLVIGLSTVLSILSAFIKHICWILSQNANGMISLFDNWDFCEDLCFKLPLFFFVGTLLDVGH